MKCYIYIEEDDHDYDDTDKFVEQILSENRFNLLDTMQAFRSNVNKIQYENLKVYVDKIDIFRLPIWIDIFCKSFDVLEWKPELERILKKHFNDLALLIAYVNSNSHQIPAGCALLLNQDKTTGLYCLGTIPSFRRQGVARKVIKVSLDIAMQENGGFLILQTFTNEGLAELYDRLGFQLIYKKKIYVLNA